MKANDDHGGILGRGCLPLNDIINTQKVSSNVNLMVYQLSFFVSVLIGLLNSSFKNVGILGK